VGDATKAREQLGWEPTYTLEAMIDEMVAFDLAQAKADAKASD
jgi:GDPmannose 4,6-dehydratase